MPLNRENGEIIEGLTGPFKVVPNAKWRETSLFETAAREASKAFKRSGALLPITFDDDEVLTQEYPLTGQIAFCFIKSIRGRENFYPYVFSFPPAAIAELKATGKWSEIMEH